MASVSPPTIGRLRLPVKLKRLAKLISLSAISWPPALAGDEVLILRGNTDNLRLVSGIAERSALAQGEALRCHDVQG